MREAQAAALTQLRSVAPVALVVTVACAALVVGSLLVARAANEGSTQLFADVYELTGSRLTGLVSMAGVMLLVAATAISLFAAGVVWPLSGSARSSRYLLGIGLLTALLVADDYLSIHEFVDDVLAMATGIEANRLLKNVLESIVLGALGLGFVALLWSCRMVLVSSEWILLAFAAPLLLASLVLDMAPHSWLAGSTGVSEEAQAVFEDTLKLAGIAFFTTYVVRTSAWVVRVVTK